MVPHPQRLQRTRRKNAVTPPGAIYVGRPTLWSNPFERRPRIGHARSVILYRAWIAGDLNPYILGRCGFGRDEVGALSRWRDQLLVALSRLRGRNLQCWCPATSPWCHADVLLRTIDAELAPLEREHSRTLGYFCPPLHGKPLYDAMARAEAQAA